MSKSLRLPFMIWVVGSTLLVVVSLRYEAVILVAALYVGLNGAAFILSMISSLEPMPVKLTLIPLDFSNAAMKSGGR